MDLYEVIKIATTAQELKPLDDRFTNKGSEMMLSTEAVNMWGAIQQKIKFLQSSF